MSIRVWGPGAGKPSLLPAKSQGGAAVPAAGARQAVHAAAAGGGSSPGAVRTAIEVRLRLQLHPPEIRVDSTQPRAELGFRLLQAAARHEAELALARWMEGVRRQVEAGAHLLPRGDGQSAAQAVADLAWAEAAAPLHAGVAVESLPRSRPAIQAREGGVTTAVILETACGEVVLQSRRSYL